MKIIISPAKAMVNSDHSFAHNSLPLYLNKSQAILDKMQSMSAAQLQELWKCNDEIAKLNTQRLARMELDTELTAAILAYDGIQYQNMCPAEFNETELAYIQEHLCIISGFYGVLRPLDGIRPYRLEMQAKLGIAGAKDLYSYWGSTIAEEIQRDCNCVINLASKEYSRCVSKYLLPKMQFITCVFGEEKDGKLIEKGTMCKIARGEMVRWMAQNRVIDPAQLVEFEGKYHKFSSEHSRENTFAYIKKQA